MEGQADKINWTAAIPETFPFDLYSPSSEMNNQIERRIGQKDLLISYDLTPTYTLKLNRGLIRTEF